ncbi:MAG TPA: hypothetical protein VD858_15340, partial [Reyranella sp.]|nr:hypothetical protein [Reyranella sp.]
MTALLSEIRFSGIPGISGRERGVASEDGPPWAGPLMVMTGATIHNSGYFVQLHDLIDDAA